MTIAKLVRSEAFVQTVIVLIVMGALSTACFVGAVLALLVEW